MQRNNKKLLWSTLSFATVIPRLPNTWKKKLLWPKCHCKKLNHLRTKIWLMRRERRRQGRTCLFRCDKKCKIKTFTNCKSLSKVLQYVHKYLQNSSVQLISIYYMIYYLLNGFKIITLLYRVEVTNFIGSYLTNLELSSCVLPINKLYLICDMVKPS